MAGVGFRNLGQRAVGIEAGGIVSKRDRQRRKTGFVVHLAVEHRELFARLLLAVADDHERAGQDLQVIAVAAQLIEAPLDVGKEFLAGGDVRRCAENDFGGFGVAS